MEFVAVLIGAAVLIGLAVWALRRRGSDEMHSVAGYQHRLERLEEVRRRQIGSVRVVGGTRPTGDAAEPVIGENGRIEISSAPANRRPNDDVDTGRFVTASPAEHLGSGPTYRRGRDVSIARMQNRPRRLGAPIAAAVAVIVLVTGLAIAGAHSRSPHKTAPPTTVHHQRHSGTTSTTTTAPPPTFTAASTSGNDATYSLPFASYTVTFKATTGACYVQITNSAGLVPYAQSLAAGATEQMALTGTSKVTLGAPSHITITVDRTPVTLPTPLPGTLNITFESSVPPPSTTTPTTG
ncbi:MAG: RodZ domain-containing protein [Acidimicrobiales bacterium]